MAWYDAYRDKYIGFVVLTRKGLYLPIIGACLPQDDDDDCLVYVTARHEKHDTLEAALAVIDAEADKLVRIFRKPSQPGGMMGHWLAPLVSNEDRMASDEQWKHFRESHQCN